MTHMQCQYLLRPGCQSFFEKDEDEFFSNWNQNIWNGLKWKLERIYEMIFIKVLIQIWYNCLWTVMNSALLSYTLITYFSGRNCFQNVIANTQFIFDPLVIKLTFVLRKENRDFVYIDKCLSSLLSMQKFFDC